MKLLYIYISAILISAALLAGCTKFSDSLIKDPNNATTASGMQLIANAEMALPSLSSSPYGVHYPQYLSNTSFTDNSRYTTVNFSFYPFYTGPLTNLENAINAQLDANQGPVVNQLAVAKILKAYFYWHMTDRWGSLPYSQALQGRANFTPAYDSQQQIYNSLFALLDEANSTIVTTNGNLKNDIVYSGDILKWKKLGNTIHLLMALRLSKVDNEKGKAEFKKALSNGIMTTNSDNLAYPHLNDANNENYWYNSFTQLGRNWFAVSKPLVDYMLPLNDPRLPVFANPNTAGNYVGLEYGKAVPNSSDIDQVSLLGSSLRRQNSPVHLVTYGQALFALAEAAKLGWIEGGDAAAKTNYKLAVENSIAQWTGSTAGTADFLAQENVKYNAVKALEQIATQRWVHLFLHGYEGWAEWRRTGYPTLVAAPGANGDRIPRREGYPTQERANNTTNYNLAVSSFPYGGADDLNTRVWWDKP
ncbi:SusD/RagB family nutrient-binding outer membrane lipoprotein [Mucilaginibacter hurinus]|uniref:SusD/RagB family nutrient-binding outer membrane lipoprotein n=1 Tax=Mucilaginibacter hurinus TaxID=2201324 RepID=A0A367GQD7_9SPHI|nr:SusD/RagB family nutrient-binding outer membrane lipoprotein [Mucilaginibacter hurinus]RCH55288.1 SusD/RagB family nutrient-binding outer membrane lipoprotein [Mucilaginibacter hurinus]